jgi:Fe-S-cluster containining protein
MTPLIIDLVQIDRLGTKKLAENERFRKHLKRHNFSDLRFRRVAEDIEDRIDCRACANCCKVAETDITKRDAVRISRKMGMSEKEFVSQYTTASAFDDEMILRRTEAGCIFLSGNDCTIYEDRPDTCRNFPHLVRGSGSIESRMWQMIDRATYCPIVYNSLEEYKDIVGFQRTPAKS